MTGKGRHSLQGLLLMTLVPALVLMTLVVAITAYQEMRRTIIAGFDAKLTAVGTGVAALIDPAIHAGLLAAVRAGTPAEEIEAGASFQHAVAPLRRIRTELGLTYLYTQAPAGGLDIVYVLDANTDDNHSPPGTTDTLPDADGRNILSVLDTGRPHITGIQQWEQWGLIKTAFVPLPTPGDGRAEAMAGADVDISVINGKLRVALISAGLIGAAVLVASLAVAVPAARRIAEPLAGMKLAGFRLAAGETSVSVPPHGAVELRDLAEAFNRMREDVRQEMARTDAAERRTEWGRRTSALLRLLNDRTPPCPPGLVLDDPDLDGACVLPAGEIVAWMTAGRQEPLRARIRSLQAAHLAGSGGTPTAQRAMDRLAPLLGHGLDALFSVEGDVLRLRSRIALTLPDGGVLAAGDYSLPLPPDRPLHLFGDGRGLAFAPATGATA